MDNWEIEVKKTWNEWSDSEWYQSLRTEEKLNKIKENPKVAFHPEMFPLLEKYVGDFKDKKVLLPSSGDNHIAFSLALLGAKVTSLDISERQLENAKEISDRWNLDITYICDNTKYLSKIEDQSFDLVFTSNGTLTWIDDINLMFKNIERGLKTNGIFSMYELHPFNRPFTGEPWKAPNIKKSYQDVFPDLHWKVSDIINAQASSGLHILEMAEFQAVDASFWYSFNELKSVKEEDVKNINDWKYNEMAAIPAWISLVSKKQ